MKLYSLLFLLFPTNSSQAFPCTSLGYRTQLVRYYNILVIIDMIRQKMNPAFVEVHNHKTSARLRPIQAKPNLSIFRIYCI